MLFYIKKERPAIVCLQEVLHGHDSFQIRGYTKYSNDTKQGLVTYINNSVPHEHIENSLSVNNNNGNTYMLFKINITDNVFYVCNTYIEKASFDETKLPNPLIFDDIIFAGDFNARHASLNKLNDNSVNFNGRKLVSFVSDFNFKTIGPNIATHKRGGRLDYFLTSGLNDAKFSFRRLETYFSDHYAIECTVSLNVECHPPHEQRRVNIPMELAASFLVFMSKTFRGTQVQNLSAQQINDMLIERIHLYHDTHVTKPSTFTQNSNN